MYDYLESILKNIFRFFVEFEFQNLLTAPIDMAWFFINDAIELIHRLKEYPEFSIIGVVFFLLCQATVKRKVARENKFVTFVNIENPNRNLYDAIRIGFWAFFAPYYPLYYVISKAIIYVPCFYILPFLLVYRLFDKEAFYDSYHINEPSARHQRALEEKYESI